MKLKYNILWFEDDPDIINDKIGKSIRQYLQDMGFIPVIDHFINGDKLDELPVNDYDLIISDLNLGANENETGDKLIKKIRDNSIYTEVLLYSATPRHILDIITNNGQMIERISFSVGIRELPLKIKNIINLTIKKVQDVNNMRGLIIAETIDLEAKLEDIVDNYFEISLNSGLTDIRNEAFNNICDKKINSNQRNLDLSNTIREQSVHKLIQDDILTVYDLYSALQGILKAHLTEINKNINKTNSGELKIILSEEKSKIEDIKDKLKKFDSEIISVRNTLAHVQEKAGPNGEPILESINKNGTTLYLNEECYVTLRKNLNYHNENLLKIQRYFETISASGLAAVTKEASSS